METTENRLCEAAIIGNVESLHEILQQDNLILDKFVAQCFGWTPLHVAVSFGHANFVTKLLDLQPKLAQVLDSKGRSPLHLAVAAQVSESTSQSPIATATQVSDSAGQLPLHLVEVAQVSDFISQSPVAVAAQISDSTRQSLPRLTATTTALDIARQLVDAAPDTCMVRDQDGRNPVHIAAIKGKVDMLEQLLQACPEAAFAMVDRDETILHLCVRYNQQQALEKLLNLIKDQEFFNVVDARGQTILQLAVSRERNEMVPLLRQSIRPDPRRPFQYVQNGLNLSSNDGIMVAASIMATVAFQVVVNPPGGVWQASSRTHKAGESVMAYHYPLLYACFILSATVGFFLSCLAMISSSSGWPFTGRTWWLTIAFYMWFALLCMGATLVISIGWLTPKKYREQLVTSVASIVVSSLFEVALILIVIFIARRFPRANG